MGEEWDLWGEMGSVGGNNGICGVRLDLWGEQWDLWGEEEFMGERMGCVG